MGKLKGKVTTSGDTGIISYKDDTGKRVDIKYVQPLSSQLGIGLNTRVAFDIVSTSDGSIAVSVAPVNKGSILEINYDAGTGTIVETESGIKYLFIQNYLKDSGFAVDQVVTYNLVLNKDVLTAVSLTLVP